VSEDMVPYQQKPVVNMDDAMLELRNLLGLTTLEFQRLALHYREAGQVELAAFATECVNSLDNRSEMLKFIPGRYQQRMKDNSI